MSLVPPTATRVPARTAEHVNRQIRQQTEANVGYFAEHPEEIDGRLEELDQEWDIERTLEANAASFSLIGLTLGGRRSTLVRHPGRGRRVPVAARLQGWCPPVPVFRRLGIRTAGEIEQESYALKMLRGDFRDSGAGERAKRSSRPTNCAAARESEPEAMTFQAAPKLFLRGCPSKKAVCQSVVEAIRGIE